MLRTTTACTFSSSQLPKVVRTWCALYILTSKCASRHNGVHFFISHLARCLRTRRFSEPTFRPSGATNHWKNTVNRDVPTFSRICIFFLLILSLLTLLTSAFQLSILSEVSLLNFLRSFGILTKSYIWSLKISSLINKIYKWGISIATASIPLIHKGHSRSRSLAQVVVVFPLIHSPPHTNLQARPFHGFHEVAVLTHWPTHMLPRFFSTIFFPLFTCFKLLVLFWF